MGGITEIITRASKVQAFYNIYQVQGLYNIYQVQGLHIARYKLTYTTNIKFYVVLTKEPSHAYNLPLLPRVVFGNILCNPV